MLKRFLTIAATVAATLGFAAPKNVVFSDMEVQVKIHHAPIVEYRTKTALPCNASAQGNREWLMIIVSFTPGVGTSERAKAMRGSWVDDVVLDVGVEVPMDGGGGRQKTSGLFTGSCKFWPIPLDGKKHTALMFVPPRLLERYMPLRGNAEAKYTEKLFRAQAVFRTADGAELGSAYFNLPMTAKAQALYFTTLANETVIKDAVFPRTKTPWAWVNVENFDLLKE